MSSIIEVAEASAMGGFSLSLGDASSTIILAVGSILVARLLDPKEGVKLTGAALCFSGMNEGTSKMLYQRFRMSLAGTLLSITTSASSYSLLPSPPG